jgi:hypothetical protein
MLIADEFLRLGLAEMVDEHVRIGQQKRQRATT